jgi:hypothetical protein
LPVRRTFLIVANIIHEHQEKATYFLGGKCNFPIFPQGFLSGCLLHQQDHSKGKKSLNP